MALRFIVAILATSAAPAVQALTCNTGSSSTYTGDCSGLGNVDYDSWSSITCVLADNCYSYSYSTEISGCWLETVSGGCDVTIGNSDSCAVQQAAFDLLGSTASDYSCSTCATDDCNFMTFQRTSGATSVKVTSAGLLGIVAAAAARL
ncbi:putative tandem protein 3 [Amphidinium carterae]